MNNITGVKIDKFMPNSEQRLQCINSGCEKSSPTEKAFWVEGMD